MESDGLPYTRMNVKIIKIVLSLYYDLTKKEKCYEHDRIP